MANDPKYPNLVCPCCGRKTLRHIEDTEPDGTGEYKQVRTCDKPGCDTLVYIVCHKPDHERVPGGYQNYND